MSTPSLICEYCAHHNTGADPRCGHCGAPLPAPAAPAPGPHSIVGDTAKAMAGTARMAGDAEHMVAAAGPAVAAAEKGFVAELMALVQQWLSRTSWRVALVGIVLLVVLGALIIRSCANSVPALGQLDAVDALPALLRSAANCQQSGGPQPGDDCVVQSSNPLLMGSITGGAPLRFSVRIQQPGQIAQTIAEWRAAGPAVLADGNVFVAIGPSYAAWYADTRTGLRIETGGFTDRAAARSFLVRAGLIL